MMTLGRRLSGRRPALRSDRAAQGQSIRLGGL